MIDCQNERVELPLDRIKRLTEYAKSIGGSGMYVSVEDMSWLLEEYRLCMESYSIAAEEMEELKKLAAQALPH